LKAFLHGITTNEILIYASVMPYLRGKRSIVCRYGSKGLG
jgi:hypothetical protein